MNDDDDEQWDMTREENIEPYLWSDLETSIKDLEDALHLGAWIGPVYKTIQQQAEMDNEETLAYQQQDRGRSREKAEDAINRLHNLLKPIVG